MIERVAVPVGQRAIEADLAAIAEIAAPLSAVRNRDCWRGPCRPRRRRPYSALRWTARSSRPGSRRSRCRTRRANRTRCRCNRAGASRRSRRHRARPSRDRRCRRAPRSRPARVIGERRGRERKPGMVVMMRHANQRHPLGQAKLLAAEFSASGSSDRDGGHRSRRPRWCAAVWRFAAIPPAPSATSVPARVG